MDLFRRERRGEEGWLQQKVMGPLFSFQSCLNKVADRMG